VKPTHLHRKTDGERRQNRGFEIAALAPSRWIVMMRRAIGLCNIDTLSQTATAGVPLLGFVPCAVVRFYVARGSSRRKGHEVSAGDAEIETARRRPYYLTYRLQARAEVTGSRPATERKRPARTSRTRSDQTRRTS
jgi:hypothetical protein